MELFADPAMLARIQFAFVVVVHFLFVPLSIGIGLIMAISETRYYKTRSAKDEAIAKFWVKIFTATFAMGVATGITMEFSFGTNWADYARYVGDIFGAPLAAEALLAFFLESVFLGVVILGRKKVSPKFFLASAWLVWFGSCLSALWILIANSWMQTPAGAALAADGSKAVLTDFFAAAFNASTLPRYFHTVLALLVIGSFVALALAAWYKHKGTHQHFVDKTLRTGAVVAVLATGALFVSAHSSAVVVTEEQPTKIAMMEGHYEQGTLPLFAIGWGDEEAQEVIAPFAIPGGTSFLASNDFSTEYPGLNDLAAENPDIKVDELPVNAVFQSYHLMVAMFGAIAVVVLIALIAAFRKKSDLLAKKPIQWLLIISPAFPLLAIQAGWFTAEIGRQPYVVYPATSSPAGLELLTNEAISHSVSAPELFITIGLFVVVYVLIMIAYLRLVARFVKEGPVEASAEAAPAAIPSFAAEEVKDAEGVRSEQADAAKSADAKGAK